MSVYEEFTLEQRAAAARRSPEDQRAFERGYAETQARISEEMRRPMPAAAVAPEARQLPAPVPAHATGARAVWLRDTLAGNVSQLFAPPDEAAELAAAKAEADRHEFTYGSRPDLAQFLHKVRGSGTGAGTVLGGPKVPTADVISQIRLVAPDRPIRMVVGPDPAASQIGGVVTAPGRGPEATGDASLAAAMLTQLNRRR